MCVIIWYATGEKEKFLPDHSRLHFIPDQKRLLLENLVEKLSSITGIAAVVLGGSYAGGTYHENSDLDIGLYYDDVSPFAIADIQLIVDGVSNDDASTVTDFYEWGKWVNGGAWIHTSHGKVDFLYRNLNQIQQTIMDAHHGIIQHDYDQQPTYGFYSVIYLAEMEICIPLYDPKGRIASLKSQVQVYPVKLKRTILMDSIWSAEFTLLHARNFAAWGDIYNTSGCLARVAGNLTQALFALNERYFIRDKQVLDTIAGFANCPPGYIQQINQILACPGDTVDQLGRSVDCLHQVWQDVVALTEGLYQPKFKV